jgi:hypothetical protein
MIEPVDMGASCRFAAGPGYRSNSSAPNGASGISALSLARVKPLRGLTFRSFRSAKTPGNCGPIPFLSFGFLLRKNPKIHTAGLPAGRLLINNCGSANERPHAELMRSGFSQGSTHAINATVACYVKYALEIICEKIYCLFKERIMEQNFSFLVSLWKNYNDASSLLTNAMGGTANEVGEFAERLVARYYNAEQLTASNKSADLKTSDNKFIQVKSRKIDHLTTTSLNVIRSWEFDILIVILFSKDGNILKAIQIASDHAKELSKWSEHQNGYVITTSKGFLENIYSKDITHELQNILDGKSNYNNENVKKEKRPREIIIPLQSKNDINKKYLNDSDIQHEVKRIQNKIAGWFQNKSQYNSRILYAYIKLFNENDGVVTVSELSKEANFTTFKSNYDQMKAIAPHNHGKIFDEKDGKVYLWNEVETIIWNYYNKYIKR